MSKTTTIVPAEENKLRTQNARLTFSIDKIKQSIADLPEEQKGAIIWVFHLAKNSGWGLKELQREVGYSTTTWHKLFSGTFEGNISNVVTKIKSFRKLYHDRQAAIAPDFVVTSLTKRIWEACDFALISQSIVFIWGENQIGKTAALEEYQRSHNHGQTIYLRISAAGGVRVFTRELARAAGVADSSQFEALRARLLKAIDDKNTIIIDEMHLLFLTYIERSALKLIEFIREIHDRTGCGLILCGTDVFRDELKHGKHKGVLAQLMNRGVAHIQLEKRPKKTDLRKFWKFYGLTDPEGAAASVVTDLVAEHGLGKFIKFLQTASRLASKREEGVTWDHFLQAHNTIKALSQKS